MPLFNGRSETNDESQYMMSVFSQASNVNHEYDQTLPLRPSLKEFELKPSNNTSNIPSSVRTNETLDLFTTQVSNQVELCSRKNWTWEKQNLALGWFSRNENTFYDPSFCNKWYKQVRPTPQALPFMISTLEQNIDGASEEFDMERDEPRGESSIWTWNKWSRIYYRSRVQRRAKHPIRSLYISNNRRTHVRCGSPTLEDQSHMEVNKRLALIPNYCLRKKEILWREQSILDSGILKYRCYAPSLLRWCWTVRSDGDADEEMNNCNNSIVLDEDQEDATPNAEEELTWDPIEPVEASNEMPWGAEREHRGGW